MGDSVAIASVVVSGAVGLGGPWLAYRFARAQRAADYTKADRDELRGALDFAAEQVEILMRRANTVHRLWQQTETSQDRGEFVVTSDAVEEFRRALDGPAVARGRLAMRLSRDDPTDLLHRYTQALDAADDYRRLLYGYEQQRTYDAPALVKARVELRSAIDHFYDGALARLGTTPAS